MTRAHREMNVVLQSSATKLAGSTYGQLEDGAQAASPPAVGRGCTPMYCLPSIYGLLQASPKPEEEGSCTSGCKAVSLFFPAGSGTRQCGQLHSSRRWEALPGTSDRPHPAGTAQGRLQGEGVNSTAQPCTEAPTKSCSLLSKLKQPGLLKQST